MESLESYIERSEIEARIVEFQEEVKSAKQAAKSLDVEEEGIVKSIVFIADDEPVLVVVPGEYRVDEEGLAEVLDAEKTEIASPEQVEEYTGYKIGAVPPVGLDLLKVVDKSVLDNRIVYAGGGSRKRLLEIDPRFIVEEDTVVGEVVER